MARGRAVAARRASGSPTWRERRCGDDPPPRAAVVEVPLLFESGMESAFDRRSRSSRTRTSARERAGARGHAVVAERAARQLSQEEKAQRADFVVRNDGIARGA